MQLKKQLMTMMISLFMYLMQHLTLITIQSQHDFVSENLQSVCKNLKRSRTYSNKFHKCHSFSSYVICIQSFEDATKIQTRRCLKYVDSSRLESRNVEVLKFSLSDFVSYLWHLYQTSLQHYLPLSFAYQSIALIFVCHATSLFN